MTTPEQDRKLLQLLHDKVPVSAAGPMTAAGGTAAGSATGRTRFQRFIIALGIAMARWGRITPDDWQHALDSAAADSAERAAKAKAANRGRAA